MNKIKQNKITFTLILSAIAIIFSSLTILSLPVLFNYKSKVAIIEKNFYKNFKIYLNSKGKISYKPFPKPHLLVENSSINLSKSEDNQDLINTTNLKIYISLKDTYLRSFENFISTEIVDTNIELKISDVKQLRSHIYKKINKPIIFNNCKIFFKNKMNEVILISPLKKITYKINEKNKTKSLFINGNIFGLNFKSEWKRNYMKPNISLHNINFYNPNIEIKNILNFKTNKNFNLETKIVYAQDKMHYLSNFNNNIINISSPNNKNTNFNLNSKTLLKPFYFDGELQINDKKAEKIIDTILLKLLNYEDIFLGNFNGVLKIKFNEIKNKLIKKGEIDLSINEKVININKAKFILDKIGYINTKLSFSEDKGEIKLISKNQLNIENHIEFAKIFQIGSNKVKNIKIINFDIIKNYEETDFLITNVKINNVENVQKSEEIFVVKNIQNLRSYIREIID